MYYLMVNWDGNEGIFCAKDGRSFKKETEHMVEEMSAILGVYYPLVDARSVEMTPDEVLEYAEGTASSLAAWMPLMEFQNQYGIAMKEVDDEDIT